MIRKEKKNQYPMKWKEMPRVYIKKLWENIAFKIANLRNDTEK